MKAWKYNPNTYDMNLVKPHDVNSAINTYRCHLVLLTVSATACA